MTMIVKVPGGTDIELRDATIADVVRRLTGTPYQETAETALGWGMGPAQLHIAAAIDSAIAAGLVRVTHVTHTAAENGTYRSNRVRFLALAASEPTP